VSDLTIIIVEKLTMESHHDSYIPQWRNASRIQLGLVL